MPAEKVSAYGWSNVARLYNGKTEVLVSLDVGPRILSYKLDGSDNLLRVFPDQAGKSGEKDYQVRGGHRIWVSPENDRTYAPDNGPARYEFRDPLAMRVETPIDARWQ